MDADSFLSLIAIVFASSYMVYMFSGKNSNPKNSKYNELFNSRISGHLMFAFAFFIIGIVRFDSLTLETFYFTPSLFIFFLLIFNQIIKRLYYRNILIEIRSNTSTYINKRSTFLDKLFGLAIIIFSIITPILMKQSNFDEINSKKKTELIKWKIPNNLSL